MTNVTAAELAAEARIWLSADGRAAFIAGWNAALAQPELVALLEAAREALAELITIDEQLLRGDAPTYVSIGRIDDLRITLAAYDEAVKQ